MLFHPILPNAYELSLRPVNIWPVEGPDGLALVDTCSPGREQVILQVILMEKL